MGLGTSSASAPGGKAGGNNGEKGSIFQFEVQESDGTTVSMEKFRGKGAYLLVNMASQ